MKYELLTEDEDRNVTALFESNKDFDSRDEAIEIAKQTVREFPNATHIAFTEGGRLVEFTSLDDLPTNDESPSETSALNELVDAGVGRAEAKRLSPADREKAIHLLDKHPLTREEAIWLRENGIALVIQFDDVPPGNEGASV